MRADGAAFSRPYVDALFEVAGSPDAVEALLPSLETVARALNCVGNWPGWRAISPRRKRPSTAFSSGYRSALRPSTV